MSKKGYYDLVEDLSIALETCICEGFLDTKQIETIKGSGEYKESLHISDMTVDVILDRLSRKGYIKNKYVSKIKEKNRYE